MDSLGSLRPEDHSSNRCGKLRQVKGAVGQGKVACNAAGGSEAQSANEKAVSSSATEVEIVAWKPTQCQSGSFTRWAAYPVPANLDLQDW